MKVAVIGAGASGSVTSILLKENNIDVILLERKDRILKKLLTTGNGRCNYTNINANYDNYFSIDKKIKEDIFIKYNYNDVINFFKELGIIPRVEKFGKVYPYSLQASAIVDALRFKIEELKIDLRLNFEVSKVRKKNNQFYIESIDGQKIVVDKLIISSGGKSYPELGSNGSGFEIARKMGHSITNLYPILVQLKSNKEYIKGLEGVKEEVILSVYNKNKLLRSDKNELLFTPYGISGPAVFNLSYLTSLNNIEDLDFVIDFMPEFTLEDIENMLFDRMEKLSYLEIQYFLNGLINKKLSQFILKSCGIEKLNIKVKDVNKEFLKNIAKKIKKFKLKCYETTGFSNAQVTAGGISFDDVDNITLESKKVSNLYFSGEILDIFGDCGGYNLNWCFISAMQVANSILKE